MTAHRTVVLCLGDAPERNPVLRQLPDPALGDVVIVDVLRLEALPLTARTVLPADDLLALARPLVVADALSSVEDVTILDARVWLADAVALRDGFDGGRAVTLVSALAESFADAKPSAAAALEAGFGRASTAAIRVRWLPGTAHLLREWREVVRQAYLRGPAFSCAAAERDLLSAWPGGRPGSTAFSQVPVACRWTDLTDRAHAPALIDLRGMAEHLRQEDASLDLIGQRSHHPGVLAALRAEVGDLDVHPRPSTWRDGPPLVPQVVAAAHALDPLGLRFPDPLGTDFRGWLEEDTGGGLSRFASAIYWSRPDLRAAYGADESIEVFANWLGEQRIAPTPGQAPARPGTGVARVARAVARRVEDVAGRRPRLGDPRPAGGAREGVNLIGFLGAGSGLGAAARATLAALRTLQVPVATVDLTERVYSPRVREDLASESGGAPYDVTLLHVNPEEVLGYSSDDLAYRIGAATRTIGVWFWETDQVPDAWRPAFSAVDEVWASSGFLRDVFSRAGDAPVVRIPLPVAPPTTTEPDRPRFGLSPTAFVVGYVCDAFSGLIRKNPLGAITAFREAFSPADDATLVLKIGNLDKFPGYAAGLIRAIGDARVVIVDEHLARQDLDTLFASFDVYLSLHAAEGYGLTVLEAMSHGLPVVATDFGGTRDFVRHDVNALTVPFRLAPARGGPGDVYTSAGSWAVPETSVAAGHLRRLFEERDFAARLGAAGGVSASERSPQAYAQVVGERLRVAGLDVG